MEEKNPGGVSCELTGTVVGWHQRKTARQVEVFFLLTPFHKTKPCCRRRDSIFRK